MEISSEEQQSCSLASVEGLMGRMKDSNFGEENVGQIV